MDAEILEVNNPVQREITFWSILDTDSWIECVRSKNPENNMIQ